MRIYHIPIFVPHKGCPHDCVFCNQKKITGQTDEVTPDTVEKTIDEYLGSISGSGNEERYIEVAFFGGSFTGIEPEQQAALMRVAHRYLLEGKIHAIRCSTRPDYINEEILSMLKEYGMSVIELGVQTTDSEVLKNANRGHSFDDVKRAAELIHSFGISLGLQMMTGLPGDTAEKSVRTAKDIISLRPDCVRIYPTLVMDGTHLMEMYRRGDYVPFTLEETVELCSELLVMFRRENIPVIRIGLQTTDNINADTVIGPYHAAIGELCTGRIVRHAIEKNMDNSALLEVTVHPSMVSAAVGHKGENKRYFAERYNTRLKVVSVAASERNLIRIVDKIVDIYE
ncbi:MAG: radical SAM protein [Clostridia bacterium]|nr:radical SAM protein [Clostridia bacterium]